MEAATIPWGRKWADPSDRMFYGLRKPEPQKLRSLRKLPGLPLRETLAHTLEQLQRTSEVYSEARAQGLEQGILSKKRWEDIIFEPPPDLHNLSFLEAFWVLSTRGYSKRVALDRSIAVSLDLDHRADIHNLVLRMHQTFRSVAIVATPKSDETDVVAITQPARRELEPRFTVKSDLMTKRHQNLSPKEWKRLMNARRRTRKIDLAL